MIKQVQLTGLICPLMLFHTEIGHQNWQLPEISGLTSTSQNLILQIVSLLNQSLSSTYKHAKPSTLRMTYGMAFMLGESIWLIPRSFLFGDSSHICLPRVMGPGWVRWFHDYIGWRGRSIGMKPECGLTSSHWNHPRLWFLSLLIVTEVCCISRRIIVK